jgi:hypothetical protein
MTGTPRRAHSVPNECRKLWNGIVRPVAVDHDELAQGAARMIVLVDLLNVNDVRGGTALVMAPPLAA